MSTDRKNKSSRRSKGKNASLQEIAGKIADTVKKVFNKKEEKDLPDEKKKKKPFGGKGGRKAAPKRMSQKAKAEIDRIKEEEAEDIGSSSQQSAATRAAAEHPASDFFYSDEKWAAAFEDEDIIAEIRSKYPDFADRNKDDQLIRRAIVCLLEDDEFMETILKKYTMNVYEFFKFLYRTEPALFKGLFVARVQKAVKGRRYANVRQPEYKFRRIRRLRKLAKKTGKPD